MLAPPFPAARVAAAPFAALLGAALLFAPAGSAVADDVTRSGDVPVIRGTVTGASRAAVTVKLTGNGEEGTEEIPAAEVIEVSWDGEPPTMGALRGRESRGRLEDALAGYRDAVDEMGQLGPLARGDVEFLIARTLGKLALNDPARRPEAAEALEEFVAGRPDHFRFDPALRLLADVQAAAGNLDAAGAALDKLKESPSPQFRTAAAVAAGELALKRGEADAALAAFEQVLRDAEGRAASEAKVGRAAALGQLNRHPEALEALDAALDEIALGDAELRARVHVRRGQSLQATGAERDAILEYLKVDVLYPGASAAHAESLYHLARLWNSARFPERAAESAAKLKSNYPNSDWAAKLSAG